MEPSIATQHPTLYDIYEGLKYWGPILTFLGLIVKLVWSVSKGMGSITTIKENHLPHLQAGIDDLKAAYKTHGEEQVSELRELRQDFRTYFRRE
jgi:hypothetical protein